MNRRTAKRQIAARLADAAFSVAEKGIHGEAGNDAERLREAAYEFAEELYRRAGLDKEAQKVDERQMSIYDELDDLLEGASDGHDEYGSI